MRAINDEKLWNAHSENITCDQITFYPEVIFNILTVYMPCLIPFDVRMQSKNKLTFILPKKKQKTYWNSTNAVISSFSFFRNFIQSSKVKKLEYSELYS